MTIKRKIGMAITGNKFLAGAMNKLGVWNMIRGQYSKSELKRFKQIKERILKDGYIEEPDLYNFEPTHRCNFKCEMCYLLDFPIDKSKELTLFEIDKIFKSLKKDKQISLIGGEIFLRGDIYHILQSIKDVGSWTYITSNGYLINDGTAELIGVMPVKGFCVSIDGPAEIHDKIRRMPDSFNKAMDAIHRVQKHIPVGINMTVTENNVKYISDVLKIAKKEGITIVNLQLESFTTKEGLEESAKVLGLDEKDFSIGVKEKNEFDDQFEKVDQFFEEIETAICNGKKLGINVWVEPEYYHENKLACLERNIRERGKSLFCSNLMYGMIDPYGDVGSCFLIRKTYGNLMKKPFDEIWNCPEIRNFRKKLLENNLLPICENCCRVKVLE